MLSSESFPLGPNNQFPRQRIANYGVNIIPPVSMQETYLSGRNTAAKLPSIEKDFHSSVQKAKGRLKHGEVIRGRRRHGNVDRFRPRYAPQSNLRGEEEYRSMDEDPVYDAFGERMDEGETDDSVGFTMGRGLQRAIATSRIIGGRVVSGRMIGSKVMRGATGERPISRSVIGSGGWLRGIT